MEVFLVDFYGKSNNVVSVLEFNGLTNINEFMYLYFYFLRFR